MDSFLIFLEFILNNLFKVSVILLGTVLAVYFLQKVYREMRLNRKLRSFQRTLRLMPKAQRRQRIFTLSSMVILPLLMVIVFFQLTRSPQIDFEHYITKVESSSDVHMIYNNYQQKFAMPVSLRSTTYDFSNMYNKDAELSIQKDTLAQTVVSDERYLYILNQNRLTIFDTKNSLQPVHKSIESIFDNISYYSPVGMYVDANNLVVVLNVYDMRIQNGNFDEVDNASETHVYVFDKHNDYSLKNNYVINGAFQAVEKHNQRIMIVTEHNIPFEKKSLNVDNYLPSYFINGIETKNQYSDVKYIQGTNPKVFLTTSTINLETQHVDQEILLTDNQYHIYMTKQAVYFSILSHVFVETSDTFVLSEPIEHTYTSITQINFERDAVTYLTTSMIEGKLIDTHSIHIYNNQLCIGTVEEVNGSYNNRVYILDDQLQTISVINANNNSNVNMKSIRFIDHYAYIMYQDDELPLSAINLEKLQVKDTKITEFSSYLYKLNNNYLLGVGYEDLKDDGIIDGINVILYNTSNDDYIYISDMKTVLFSDYGFTVSEALRNKDFIYIANQQKLLFPLNMHVRMNSYSTQGVLVFDVDFTDGIELITMLNHPGSSVIFNNYRSIIHGDYLYTISNEYISVSHINDINITLNTYDLK